MLPRSFCDSSKKIQKYPAITSLYRPSFRGTACKYVDPNVITMDHVKQVDLQLATQI